MKNGIVYKYEHENWDLKDESPNTSGRLREAIPRLTKTLQEQSKPRNSQAEMKHGNYTSWSFVSDIKKRSGKRGRVLFPSNLLCI
jgi:hypothetical protein